MIDTVYTNGDSWVHGSELLDRDQLWNTDHFSTVHDDYRKKHHWPRLVSDRLGLDLVDGSQPGSGNDRILRTSIYDLAELIRQGRKPLAVIAWSQLHRFELPNVGREAPGLWRNFVSPNEENVPHVAQMIWGQWSNDYADTVRWVTELICLHSFCRTNQIPILGLTIFNSSYRLLEDQMHTKHFAPYLAQLHGTCSLSNQVYQFSLESVLRQHPGIEYGPGGHPLEQGHRVLSDFVLDNLGRRLNIKPGKE